MGKRDTMTITLKPTTEALLREKAQQEGRDMDSLVDMLLADSLEAEARRTEEDAEAVRAAMAAAEAGREKPMAQYLAEQRAKHGYPDTWPRRDLVKEVAPGVFVDNLQAENNH